MILRPAPPEHYDWLAERAQVIVGPTFRAIEALGEGGQIVGMVAIEGAIPNCSMLHIAMEQPDAVPREVRRQALKLLVTAAFRTVFLGLWKKVALCHVLSTNERSLALVRRVGFREVFRGKDYWEDGVDLIGFEMRKEDCTWIPKE